MPQLNSGHSIYPVGFEAGESKLKAKIERKSEILMEEYMSALKAEPSMNMEKPSTSELVGLIFPLSNFLLTL